MQIVKPVLAATALKEVNGAVPLSELETLFSNAVTALLGLAGIALFVMLLMGGLKYLTSVGDPKAVEDAKKTLTYAIGGIVLIALAFLILQLIQTITGAPVTIFRIVGGWSGGPGAGGAGGGGSSGFGGP